FSPDAAIGRNQGNGVRFDLRERAQDEDGEEVTITAASALQSGRIQVELDVLYNESGDRLRASVPFTKSSLFGDGRPAVPGIAPDACDTRTGAARGPSVLVST